MITYWYHITARFLGQFLPPAAVNQCESSSLRQSAWSHNSPLDRPIIYSIIYIYGWWLAKNNHIIHHKNHDNSHDSIIWVNYNDLTATSLESWLVREIIPKRP